MHAGSYLAIVKLGGRGEGTRCKLATESLRLLLATHPTPSNPRSHLHKINHTADFGKLNHAADKRDAAAHAANRGRGRSDLVSDGLQVAVPF